MAGRFADMKTRYEIVGDVRGRGLLQGIELVTSKATRQPAPGLGAEVTANCLERGLHTNIVQLPGAGASIIRIAPPLTISDEDMAKGLDILDKSIEATR